MSQMVSTILISGVDRFKEIRYMFSRLKEDYREGIIRHWRRDMNERLMVINRYDGPTEILSDDPHEVRFLRDTEETTAGAPSLDPKLALSSPELPDQGDISRYFPFWVRNPRVANL